LINVFFILIVFGFGLVSLVFYGSVTSRPKARRHSRNEVLVQANYHDRFAALMWCKKQPNYIHPPYYRQSPERGVFASVGSSRSDWWPSCRRRGLLQIVRGLRSGR
jgi:hypothetical protein